MDVLIRLMGAVSLRAVGLVLLIPAVRIVQKFIGGSAISVLGALVAAACAALALWFLSGRPAHWLARPGARRMAVAGAGAAGSAVVLVAEVVGSIQANDVVRLAIFMPLVLAALGLFLALCFRPGPYARQLVARGPVIKPARVKPATVPAAKVSADQPRDEILELLEPDEDEGGEEVGEEAEGGQSNDEKARKDWTFEEPENVTPAPPPPQIHAEPARAPRDYAYAANRRVVQEKTAPRKVVSDRMERGASLLVVLVVGFGLFAWAFAAFVPTAGTVAVVRMLTIPFAILGAVAMLATSWNNRPGRSRFHIPNPYIRRPVAAVIGAALFWVLAMPILSRGLPWVESHLVAGDRTSINGRVVERGAGKQMLGCSYILVATFAVPYDGQPHWICTSNPRLWTGAGAGSRIVLRGVRTPRGVRYTSVAAG